MHITLGYIIIKSLKASDNEKFFKAAGGGNTVINTEGKVTRM
jgi:hypothetical protein